MTKRILATVQAAGNQVITTGDRGANSTTGVGSLVSGKQPWSEFPGPKITVGTTAPTSPSVGDIWVDTT